MFWYSLHFFSSSSALFTDLGPPSLKGSVKIFLILLKNSNRLSLMLWLGKWKIIKWKQMTHLIVIFYGFFCCVCVRGVYLFLIFFWHFPMPINWLLTPQIFWDSEQNLNCSNTRLIWTTIAETSLFPESYLFDFYLWHKFGKFHAVFVIWVSWNLI